MELSKLFKPAHQKIQTRYVFNKNQQVFIKTNNSPKNSGDTPMEWFPTDFSWQPIAIYPPPLGSSEQQ